MRQAREDNLRRPEPERLPVLKRETINDGYITFLRQLWGFAVGNRGAEVNIFKDVRVVSKWHRQGDPGRSLPGAERPGRSPAGS
ncbi:hypothetical protein IGS68_11175 [Skermanella sp. TT6]|uniref:Uncharacterized protein n=1 Tax=Skermanella cutis TaxID=2775420 RepID=A0ABX7BBG2_9PROT|nr:hypothetical protein [Skermanella sp. TT6]QQP91721.1 hypothetical protein IGS68_11175 [Skermanella sp. TT6]